MGLQTAYDQDHARFGPGALVETEATMAMIATRASPGWIPVPMAATALISEIWPGIREMADIMIAVRPGRSRLLTAMLAAEQTRRALRTRLRSAYWRLVEFKAATVSS